jgi:transposase
VRAAFPACQPVAPERALVLCVDEKGQIQALAAAASHAPGPSRAARPGQVEQRTHDYTRHGTLTLFAALDAATGKVIGRCHPRHRAREFLSFPREIERNVPPEREVRLIMDNSATQKTPAIQKWLGARPRWHVHFTPTASSWVNLVDRFFAAISEKQIRCARRVDVIVVYEVDRLTRSLTDFAKLVELFDEFDVSFISVTQAFNTTTSMGRLTLNMLLSFAQFEREITGERIRDKVAASKKRGIWMGGAVPFGYRVENRALHIVEEHAKFVRDLF